MMVAVSVPPTDSEVLQKMQDTMQSGSEESIRKACGEGVLRFSTVGPGDLLYIPPGAIVSHKVHSQDVLGIRFGILADEMKPMAGVPSASGIAATSIGGGAHRGCHEAEAFATWDRQR